MLLDLEISISLGSFLLNVSAEKKGVFRFFVWKGSNIFLFKTGCVFFSYYCVKIHFIAATNKDKSDELKVHSLPPLFLHKLYTCPVSTERIF